MGSASLSLMNSLGEVYKQNGIILGRRNLTLTVIMTKVVTVGLRGECDRRGMREENDGERGDERERMRRN